jgi:RimJ/RimL family protein N-acetyltransferase
VIRRAAPADVDFVAALLDHEEVAPFLAAVREKGREATLERIERSLRDPAQFGVFVIEEDGQLAGMIEFEESNRRSRIAHLGGLAVHPDFRGRRVADDAAREFQRHVLLDLGYHRLEFEIYEFNERAMRLGERVGCVREGERRKAYRRQGRWVGSALYALVREDLGLPPGTDFLYEYVARHNLGIRHGDWESLGECFADDAVLEFEGIPIGPFAGRGAIVSAYTERPPDDEVRVLSADEGDPVVARYAWAAASEKDAGRLELTLAEERIARLLVGYGRN